MAYRVPVQIGVRSVQFVQVLGGLSEGDRVVLSGIGVEFTSMGSDRISSKVAWT